MSTERRRDAAAADRRAHTVVVTGASGFIGRHVCAALSRGGWTVRALVRRAGTTLSPGVECIIQPDLTDEASLGKAFEGAVAVVHLAGRAHVIGDRASDSAERFHASNVAPTIACAGAAVQAGAGTFVFMSSVAAVAGNDDGTISDETIARPVNEYGRSKLAAENALAALAATSSMRAISLRPPMVYGPGMRGNPLRLFRLVASGLPLPLGALRNARTILYVENLAAMVAVVLTSAEHSAPRSYLVGDPEPISTAELVRRIAGALDRRARVVPVPMPLLRAAALTGDLLGRVVAVPLDSTALRGLAGTLVLDSSAFQRRFGAGGVVALDDALAETARWFSNTSGGQSTSPC